MHLSPSQKTTAMTLIDKAIRDFPGAKLELFSDPWVDPPEELIHAVGCLFDPQILVDKISHWPSVQEQLPLKKEQWGWGIIEVSDNGSGEPVVGGIFDIGNKDDWTNGRLYYALKIFNGFYNEISGEWTFILQ